MRFLPRLWYARPVVRRSGRLWLFLLSVTLLPSLGVPRVHAQDATANETALARRLFRQGIEAAREGDFQAARRHFARSYALSPRPVTLLNLAGAQAQTSALVDAVEGYRVYLRITRDDGDPRRRAAAEQALAELGPRIPQVVIRLDNLAEGDVIKLDDDDIVHAVVGESLPVNPGPHSLSVERSGNALIYEEFAIEEGAREEVHLTLPEADPSATHTVPTPRETARTGVGTGRHTGDGRERGGEEDEGGGVLSSPVFWIVVGALLVGGGVAGYLLFFNDGGTDPFRGNLGPGHLALD